MMKHVLEYLIYALPTFLTTTFLIASIPIILKFFPTQLTMGY